MVLGFGLENLVYAGWMGGQMKHRGKVGAAKRLQPVLAQNGRIEGLLAGRDGGEGGKAGRRPDVESGNGADEHGFFIQARVGFEPLGQANAALGVATKTVASGKQIDEGGEFVLVGQHGDIRDLFFQCGGHLWRIHRNTPIRIRQGQVRALGIVSGEPPFRRHGETVLGIQRMPERPYVKAFVLSGHWSLASPLTCSTITHNPPL